MIRRPPRSTRTDHTLSLHDALPICTGGGGKGADVADMGADVDENVARLQPRDDELDQRALVVGTAVLGSHLLECHRTWIRGGEADGPAAWRHGAPGLAGGIARAALAEQSAELHQDRKSTRLNSSH